MKVNQRVINELYVRVDWLEFTVERNNYSQSDVLKCIKEFGFDTQHFDLMGRGGFGYKNSFKHITENITVYFDGNENMGIHFRISGSAVSYVLGIYLDKYRIESPFDDACFDIKGGYDIDSILLFFCEKVLNLGHFTRIDLAIDDIGCNYFSVSDVVNFAQNCQLLTKFHQWRNVCGQSFADGCTGHTAYFGSRESDVFLRVYEKGLEQEVPMRWVRWELEIKHEKADVVAGEIIKKFDFGAVTMGVLKSYMRFIVLDNNRRSRCSLHPTWERFINDVQVVHLSLPTKHSTVENKEKWIMRQCMPTIAGLIYSKMGDMSFMLDDLEGQFDRLSGRDKKLFENERGAADAC